MQKKVSKQPFFLYVVLLLFVIIPIMRLSQSETMVSIRSVDFLAIFTAGMALGALLAVVITRFWLSRDTVEEA